MSPFTETTLNKVQPLNERTLTKDKLEPGISRDKRDSFGAILKSII
jgi:hypothetical protein